MANEVRTLAENSARSTREIAKLIKNINRDIEESVRGIEEGAGEIISGVELASSGRQVLDEITSQVGETQGEMVKLSAEALRNTYDVTLRCIQNIARVIEGNREATAGMTEQSELMTGHIAPSLLQVKRRRLARRKFQPLLRNNMALWRR